MHGVVGLAADLTVDACAVDDAIAAGQGRAQCLAVKVGKVESGPSREQHDFVARRLQASNEVVADEAGPTSDREALSDVRHGLP
jgi:hypothetical protein